MKIFSLIIFGILLLPINLAWGSDLKVGQKAPEFTAPTDGAKSLSLSDLAGKMVVLYFYPKDDTPGCTIEAKGFRELYPKFQAQGIQVVGVSYDSVESHREFKGTYDLPYPLVSDSKREVAKAYGVAQAFFAERATFVISPQGKLVAIYRDVNPSGHAQEVLDWVQKYQESLKSGGKDPTS